MIIETKKDFIDLEAPIFMVESQRKEFIKGMKKIFGERIKTKEIIEPKKEMKDVERHPVKFTNEDLLVLAQSDLTNEEVAKKLDKSQFAIQMKRGNFLVEIQDWIRKKGKNKITKEDIKEFLESR